VELSLIPGKMAEQTKLKILLVYICSLLYDRVKWVDFCVRLSLSAWRTPVNHPQSRCLLLICSVSQLLRLYLSISMHSLF